MITSVEELTFSRRRLQELQTRYSRIVSDAAKDWRAKEMELAGVRGVMQEIEAEMLTYIRTQLQQALDMMRLTDAPQLSMSLDMSLQGLDAVADGLRLTSSPTV
jgi:sugar phosphate isomerase/epimerase